MPKNHKQTTCRDTGINPYTYSYEPAYAHTHVCPKPCKNAIFAPTNTHMHMHQHI